MAGFIEQPGSRAFLASKRVNTGAGAAALEPQGIEGPKGFPAGGPPDGQIASAGNPQFTELNAQTATRWSRVDAKAGDLTVSWKIIAPVRTAGFAYFITRNGWNPDRPLTRGAFEVKPLLVDDKVNGTVPSGTVTHHVTVPSDRSGYHVILGIWESADTQTAIYQVIDMDITN
ncbi:lytic polysaccharide monooxygenase [Streptomyces sp. NPDC048209]|uniref:lytic polysaccharide monooxygenase n=1 Tax=Streptomyces sp. NPDC048209 TaxID=3156689 RepID=UPI00341B2386